MENALNKWSSVGKISTLHTNLMGHTLLLGTGYVPCSSFKIFVQNFTLLLWWWLIFVCIKWKYAYEMLHIFYMLLPFLSSIANTHTKHHHHCGCYHPQLHQHMYAFPKVFCKSWKKCLPILYAILCGKNTMRIYICFVSISHGGWLRWY